MSNELTFVPLNKLVRSSLNVRKTGADSIDDLAAVSTQQLTSALSTITDFLRTSSTTGGGRRLRQFVWSLWNDSHLINLFDLCHGLDGPLTDAVIIVFQAAIVGVLSEDHLRNLLVESGEMARWIAHNVTLLSISTCFIIRICPLVL